VAAGVGDVSCNEDLVRPHLTDIDIEVRGGACPAANARVYAPKLIVERVLELGSRETGDGQLPNVGNDDEPLARNGELVRLLDVAGEKEHQLVAGSESVIRIRDRAGIGIELC